MDKIALWLSDNLIVPLMVGIIGILISYIKRQVLSKGEKLNIIRKKQLTEIYAPLKKLFLQYKLKKIKRKNLINHIEKIIENNLVLADDRLVEIYQNIFLHMYPKGTEEKDEQLVKQIKEFEEYLDYNYDFLKKSLNYQIKITSNREKIDQAIDLLVVTCAMMCVCYLALWIFPPAHKILIYISLFFVSILGGFVIYLGVYLFKWGTDVVQLLKK